MHLLQHPDETRDNKSKLRALCDIWYRKIEAKETTSNDDPKDNRSLEESRQPTLLARRRLSSSDNNVNAGNSDSAASR